jgi:hypothetical protein
MRTTRRCVGAGLIGVMIAACACARAPDPARDMASAWGSERPKALPSPPVALAAPVLPAAPELRAAPAARQEIDRERYPWLDGATDLGAVSTLEDRIAPPAGFTRAELAPGSFGAWLRRLPLTAKGTPVRSHRGEVIYPPDHANVAAVVAIDVGAQNLQQCADAVIRLHAEWLWSQGRRDQSYRAADRTPMPFARWARGERVVPRGNAIAWTATGGRADSSHAAFRSFLDAVFAWTNTVALARDTRAVDLADLHPGDFVVQPGTPGHSVLVLDLAAAADGRRAVLLGQSYMPAQSFQVLRPSPASAWFIVDPAGLETPFWSAFPWSTLHRFPGA